MALKKPEAPAGAPDWIVTYGDMMSLLLCFFILLAAMANFDDQDKMMMTAMESIREALGSPGQRGWLPDNVLDFKALMVELEAARAQDKPLNRGFSEQQGVSGRYYRVRRLRDGLEISIGGPIAFDRFSAVLLPEAAELVDQVAVRLRGHRNKLEIRGHTTHEPLPADSPFHDHVDLGYARARAVLQRLMAGGVSPDQARLTAVGPHEPLTAQAYTEEKRAENRRVEIVILESLVSDYDPRTGKPTTRSGPATTQP